MKKVHIGIVDSVIDESCLVVMPSNIYGAMIGENSFIGPFTEIQTGVIIGKSVRIQSHSFICSGVEIGDNTFVGHGVVFINDPFSDGGPARGDSSKYRKTLIGENVSIGSNATILPVSICANVVIGAGAVVTKNITSEGVYLGNPAKKSRK
jgi:acetyltransferase-like isoleucine patch superfamily enzyme